jgi:flagellar protein FliS
MGYSNAYNAYQKTNVNTASQGRLVVLLYEGIVKQLTLAETYIEEDGKIKPKNIEKFGICIQKAQAIITELQVSLDMEKGGDIARNLMSLYVFFNEELLAANINHNKEKIEFVLKMVKDLADSWRQIANSVANAPAANVQSVLNIQG